MKRILLGLALVMMVGCAHPHKVIDTTTGTVYYTKKVKHIKRDGSVRFKDARTGSEVTLASSSVKRISKKEYKEGLGK